MSKTGIKLLSIILSVSIFLPHGVYAEESIIIDNTKETVIGNTENSSDTKEESNGIGDPDSSEESNSNEESTNVEGLEGVIEGESNNTKDDSGQGTEESTSNSEGAEGNSGESNNSEESEVAEGTEESNNSEGVDNTEGSSSSSNENQSEESESMIEPTETPIEMESQNNINTLDVSSIPSVEEESTIQSNFLMSDNTPTVMTLSSSTILGSGTCGTNIEWYFYSDGFLEILGTGDMEDFIDGPPWSDCLSDITSVSLSDNIKNIGDWAFSGCTVLRSVVLNRITRIGWGAFELCSDLTSIVIPNTVTEIDGYAFAQSGLTSIKIPNSISNIPKGVFEQCIDLIDVELPSGITSIGDYAFNGCSSLSDITIPDNVISIGTDAFSGCASGFKIHGKAGSYAETYAQENGITFVVIAEPTPIPTSTSTPTSIPEVVDFLYTTYSSYVEVRGYIGSDTDIAIPSEINGKSVTRISNNAFKNCVDLTSVEIPDSVEIIGDLAFYGCAGLTSITIPCDVYSVGNGAFANCENLTQINVDSNNTRFKSIDGVLFEGNYSLVQYPAGKTHTEYVVLSTVEQIYDKAFDGCINLTNVTILVGDYVTTIGNSTFNGCTNLTDIYVNVPEGSIPGAPWGATNATIHYSTVSGYCGANADGKNIKWTVPNANTLIFEGTGAMKDDCLDSWYAYLSSDYSVPLNITFSEGITHIGSQAFDVDYGQYNISVEFPSTLESIGKEAFVCAGITALDLRNTNIKEIGERAFYITNLTSVKLPDTVTSIGVGAFSSNEFLTSIDIDENNEYYCTIDGVLLSKDRTKFICYPAGKSATSYTIPKGVQYIVDYAFDYVRDLNEVTISDGVISIGDYVFEDSGLVSITIPNSMKSISSTAFWYTFPTDIYINNVEGSISGAPWGADSSVVVHWKEVTASGYCGADVDKKNIKWTVYSDKSVVFEGTGAMEDYVYSTSGGDWYAYLATESGPVVVSSVVFSEGITHIGAFAFGVDFNCDFDIVFPSTLQSIGNDAFACAGITYLDLTNTNIREINQDAFGLCYNLKNVILPNTIISIAGDAFHDCDILSNISIDKVENSVSGAPWGETNVTVNWLRTLDYTEGDITYLSTGVIIDVAVKEYKGSTVIRTLISGTDYTIAYSNNTSSGQGIYTVTFKGNYSGVPNYIGTYTISLILITDCTIDTIASQSYTGSVITPVPTITYSGSSLVNRTNFILTYENNINAGTATVIITGKGNYTGSISKTFTITPISGNVLTINSIGVQTYTGRAITPDVVIYFEP